MKQGLVLEGGALRGLFSVGVMDVLMEHNVRFDGAIGVSAGASFGCNYKSGQIGRVLRYNKRFAKDWRYCSVRSFITTGELFGGEFCFHTFPTQLDLFDDEAFDSNPMEFYVVCTDVETGKAHYQKLMHSDWDSAEWIRASSSMPLAAKIIEMGGRKYMDGGITDSIPLKYFLDLGYEKNLVILTQPLGFEKKQTSLFPLIKWKYRAYPEFVDAIANRPNMYNDTLRLVSEEVEKGRALVVCPPATLPINHVSHNPDLMQEVYEIGRKTADENLERILTYLQL
ncbi:MAG: patatin family protein [Paludibacteraceae bacterium]|nr:patatin family protein [Paludibacteraceae bacterium]